MEAAVAVMFRGESLNKLDAKGRVSIPASFRRVLQSCDPQSGDGQPSRVVVVYGPDSRNHLACYTIESMAEIERGIAAMPRGTPTRRALERIYTGQAVELVVDEGGRMVLPQRCREKLGETANAYFIAAGDMFEIWNPEVFEAEGADLGEDALADLPPGADPLILLEQRSQ